LLSTNIGIMDYVGRICADAIRVSWAKDSEFWSESKIYFAIVWLLVVSGTIILLSGMNDPVTLLTIASASGGVVMFIYSCLLLVLNRGHLPAAIRVRGVRMGALVWAILYYGVGVRLPDMGRRHTHADGRLAAAMIKRLWLRWPRSYGPFS
jgi:hypothetical protein